MSGDCGAVADAIGARLARLADGLQVLAVTHSPQVAARASQHLLISLPGKLMNLILGLAMLLLIEFYIIC